MKTTPFKQIVQSEMARLESIVANYDRRIGGQVALVRQSKPTKNKHFLLHFLKYKLSF